MRQILRKIVLSLAVLGGALLLMGSSIAPPIHFEPTLSWSRSGKHIVFSVGYVGAFVVDPAGVHLSTIPRHAPLGDGFGAGNATPSVSPDGSRIAYVVRESSSATAIETAAIDGTGARRLTVYTDIDNDGSIDKHIDMSPVWSPDGNRIAFKSSRSESRWRFRLFVMDADGSNVQALAPSVSLESEIPGRPPAWSSDGRWLAFLGEGEGNEERRGQEGGFYLYTVRDDGTNLTRIGEVRSSVMPEWSPDGSLLAFVSAESGEGAERQSVLYTVQPDGTGPTRIGDGVSAAAWSPDGAWLAYSRIEEEGPATYVVRPDGADLKLVAPDHGGLVTWSPDGSEVYVENRQYAVRRDGSGLRRHVSEETHDLQAEYLTAWSPDGLRLAVLAPGDGAVTLYTIERDGANRRVLVRGTANRFVAEHSGWYEAPRNLAACSEGLIVPEPEAHPGLVEDCKILLALRDALIADGYVDWSAVWPIAAWQGVEVGCPSRFRVVIITAWKEAGPGCSSPYRVIGLRLSSLRGAMPPELGKFLELESLTLGFPEYRRSSDVLETIPPELGNLAHLKELQLSGSRLSGNIPKELGKLGELEEFRLYFTRVSGNIPTELGKLSKLKILHLLGNEMRGGIPPELGDLRHLRELEIAFHHSAGTIPREFGSLVNLERLSLAEVHLSGSIPPELGNLVKLKTLIIGAKDLSGAIPPELGNLANLEVLKLIGSWFDPDSRLSNKLSGSIPPELGKLTNLTELWLLSSELTGCLPASLSGQLTYLWAYVEYCAE